MADGQALLQDSSKPAGRRWGVVNLIGTHAERPTASSAPGATFFETDTAKLFLSDGSAWTQIAPNPVAFDHFDAEQTIVATGYADLPGGSPSVSVTVPTNGMVTLFVQGELKGDNTNALNLGLYEATDLATPQTIFNRSANTFAVVRTAANSANGVTTALSSWLAYPATGGKRTYKLQGKVAAGAGGFSRNLKLWAKVEG